MSKIYPMLILFIAVYSQSHSWSIGNWSSQESLLGQLELALHMNYFLELTRPNIQWEWIICYDLLSSQCPNSTLTLTLVALCWVDYGTLSYAFPRYLPDQYPGTTLNNFWTNFHLWCRIPPLRPTKEIGYWRVTNVVVDIQEIMICQSQQSIVL